MAGVCHRSGCIHRTSGTLSGSQWCLAQILCILWGSEAAALADGS